MTWIKICGMTTPEAVAAAVAAQADAMGFVFAESSRKVTAEQARKLAEPARGRLVCVAVTRHPTQAMIDEIMAGLRPDVLQTDIEDLPGLRLPATLEILPVVRSGQGLEQMLPARLLYEGPKSGSGETCDWRTASAMALRTQLVLAGGLNTANVVAAISQVRPFGVDVSSGVEDRPGVKSSREIARFVAAARSVEPFLPMTRGVRS
ncbi:MAG TPA: phosphoribosylanthranilate isomerase [Steroidobacteraceae bacterium]|nr:phosphoribosylanthranilate isomerase [Steroidobacteraceae bacterium]